jgi:hypothetical protein
VGTGLTSEEHQSDRCATTQSGIFEAEDTRRDHMACVEAKQGAVVGLWTPHEVFLLSPKSCSSPWRDSGDRSLDLEELTRG